MNKKVVYLALISVIIMGIGINVSHQAFMWGFETVSGGDEFMHFSRAQSIANGYVDAYHEYDNPDFYDFYPSGFHLLSAEFIVLSDFAPHYYISFLFKVIYAFLVGLLVFLIGSKVNWKVGLFSVFFIATYFKIYTWSKTFYINVASPQNTIGSVFVSTPFIFISILIYILFIKTKDNELKLGALMTLIGVAHGISHISTYIGFLSNFLGFSVFIFIISIIKYRQYIFKTIKIILYILLSFPFVFFIYYYPMYPEVLGSKYIPEKFFPGFIPVEFVKYLPIISVLLLVFSAIVLFIINSYSKKLSISSVKIGKPLFAGLLLAYLLMYALVLFLVTKSPYSYPKTGELILLGIFPTYIPKNLLHAGFVPIASLLVGFSMYALTVLSFISAYKFRSSNRDIILLIYVSFFTIWFIFAIIIKYYAARILYFQYALVFLYALGIVSLITINVSKESRHFKRKKIFSVYNCIISMYRSNTLRKFITVLIVVMFLSMSAVSQITKEPELRDRLDTDRPHIGKPRPPRDVSSFLYTVDAITDKNEYILATPETLEVATSICGLRSPTNHYSQTYRDNTNWGITASAVRGQNMERFFNKYDARYLIVGYGDIHGFPGIFGHKYHDPDIYSRNSDLILIYEDQYGERIYEWAGSS